ncbi:UDP-4-amino-4,6-dideoxy-N-acetyl-beta-L-altrosamine transaminase [Bordetella genomosp. 13]|uniref:UDP-4-amino-4, 6-dideoxy-N-acetyl-beta-L-altrosamine transaminase n=1 Tax=Bordetella genomosp. 13 TaxID=463040 RepID=A0A1W6ZA09_9BORD|nr:UDP-4-amino-4,6-dideoxy-N-acetyl-beta-L-altrosamine transaminase [Bordetella genomosp. 13]ARP94075.1 UDP-4-amino-4,6-dideoxy-N-acetyl-beta-L-altrosamine transaminase [Bordetella genomosp. 13]
MIPYGRQDITREDCLAVQEVLQSDFLTQGPAVGRFENAVAAYCQAAAGSAFSSATAALHGAYHALGVGAGDLVWTTPNTFVATANAALYLGADVDFVDIDAATLNMSVDALQSKLEQAKEFGRLPKVVVPVHFAGQCCDMQAIAALSKAYGFRIVEDASHAIGGRYQGHPVGSCRYSDITVFSFHPVKIITTGEGGLATTNSAELKNRMDLFRAHGVTRDGALMRASQHGAWYYEMVSLGYNYRMTDIQAALGLSQLTRVDDYVARRHDIASMYDQAFRDIGVRLPAQSKSQYSGYHLYVIRWPDGLGGRTRRQAFDYLKEHGLYVNVHYIPVHLQPYYQDLGFKLGQFPKAEEYYGEAITLPLFPGLLEGDIAHVIASVRACAGRKP